jgi:predicted metal-dependent enzyme (double-stranded beta helix superfamily)
VHLFIKDVDRVVRTCHSESEVLMHLKPLMKELIASSNNIPPDAFRPRKDRFANNLIYMPKDKVFSINGAVWLPGQTTPIHDHLTWAIVGIVEGEERESIYRRTDDGSDPKRTSLQRVSERINQKGHVTVLGRAGIHRIDNVSDKPSLSVHMYGLDIGNSERHSYDPVTGEIGTFVSGYCNVLRDFE